MELLKEKLIESAPTRVVILSSESHRQPKVTGIKYEELAVESKECSCNLFHIPIGIQSASVGGDVELLHF